MEIGSENGGFTEGDIHICGSPKEPNTWIYRSKKSGIFIHEIPVESVTPGREAVNIAAIADIHINATNQQDLSNEEVMHTKECRHWNADGASVKALDKAMAYAGRWDQTVLLGDTLDYLSYGSMELMERHVWRVDPGCLAALGGHDVTRQMETGLKDQTPLGERQAVLAGFWRHNIFYTSRLLKNHVMVIQLDNGCGCYWDCQVPQLSQDLKLAREYGYTVLIFQHEPVCTQHEEDAQKRAYYVWDICRERRNFYDEVIGYGLTEENATKRVYDLITQNADIVRGLFCGHYHTSFYTEVAGSYRDEAGILHQRSIPQHLLECNAYENYAGHVMKISVM